MSIKHRCTHGTFQFIFNTLLSVVFASGITSLTHVVLCWSLTSLTPNFQPSQRSQNLFAFCDVSAATASPPLRPLLTVTCVHMSVVCLWFPLFQEEASPPLRPSPDLSLVPPSLCSGDKQPDSSFFLHRYTLLAVLFVF